MLKIKNKKIITIIPARGGSKGIPGKNIIDFCGKPLVVWSIEQARLSNYASDVHVSSDDSKILSVCEKAGAEVIKRPKELATDTSSSEEVLLHALDYTEKKVKSKIDYVVFLQATSPLRTSEDIDNAVKTIISEGADSLFSASLLDDFCIWELKDKKYRSFTYDYKNRGRRQDRNPYYLENGSIYIFKPQILKKYKNRFGGKISAYIMPFWKSFEIDRLEDIEMCKYYMRYMQNKILK